MDDFDVALCGQCGTCQCYFPCEQLCVLQVQNDGAYQDTSRLVCFECQRSMNPQAYRTRELTRREVATALRRWLVQRQHSSEEPFSR